SFSDEATDRMKKYGWPGNVRELENVIERAFLICKGDTITEEHLPEDLMESTDSINISLPQHYTGPLDFDRFKEETEKEFIVQALRANRGKINQTVASANIPKNTLLRKIKKYDINVKDFFEDEQHY
ncbi:MAG: sigma-54-dependent Fis family transcriptional regulator, partial [Bdellovibrionales bacterium]|nr:sigma-54-dependent Fis family transcriptional regulator [Bdellovibrionales bacterium]